MRYGSRIKNIVLIALLLVFTYSCKKELSVENVQIAFIADVHLSDIYAEFDDCSYRGVLNPANQKYVTIRTMASQLHSTRIFNENYFAFRAALDDVAKRNIRYVVLPGDFSDDGQPYNVNGLNKILKAYASNYGIQFFAITGNHDPVTPFTIDAGKRDYLGKDGKPQAIMSKDGLYSPQCPDENPVVITKDVSRMGYEQIVSTLGQNGFMPQKSYEYWETPFTTYKYEDYNYYKAVSESTLAQRSYFVDSLGGKLPDVSYLVEPVTGLWLLALDGNVFVPAGDDESRFTRAKLENGGEFSNVIAYKHYLVKWVGKVVQESKRLNKTLIVFSHYPMVDFYDGAAKEMESFFGRKKMQLQRVPDTDISKLFAEAGVKLQFGGHLHFNDTGLENFEDGSFLVNIQVPSLAGYPAAYKILTIKNRNEMEVETVKMDSVTGFDELFPLYEKEIAYLQKSGAREIWNKDVLSSKSYGDLMDWHLKELVRLRFFKSDWPEDFKDFMLKENGVSLQKYAGINNVDTTASYKWSGFDMIFDFYRVLNGDQLAVNDIGVDRVAQYKTIINAELKKSLVNSEELDSLQVDFHLFIAIFNKVLHGEPSDHFIIDMNQGKLIDLTS